MHSYLAVFGLHILKYIVWFKGETWIVHVVFILVKIQIVNLLCWGQVSYRSIYREGV